MQSRLTIVQLTAVNGTRSVTVILVEYLPPLANVRPQRLELVQFNAARPVAIKHSYTDRQRYSTTSRQLHGFIKVNPCETMMLHTHTFNGPLSGTTQVSQYQKGQTNLDFTEAGDSEWQWHQLGRMQVCTSLQTDNHASTPPLSFYRPDALPATQQQRESTEGIIWCYWKSFWLQKQKHSWKMTRQITVGEAYKDTSAGKKFITFMTYLRLEQALTKPVTIFNK